jgi:hypothetical protein
MLQNSIVYFQGLRLSVVLFDASVLLWSAFPGGWVLVCFFLLGGALLRGAFQILYTMRRRLIDREDANS